MSENVSVKNGSENEPSFKVNYVTLILALVIIIPLVYTVVANLQTPAPPPVITPAASNTATGNQSQPASTSNAVEIALKAVVDNPGFDTYTNLGIAYYGVGKFDDAVKSWQKSLDYNPKSELAYNNIAAGYGALNNWDEEIKACQKALALNPNFDLAKRNLAWAMSKKTGK